VEIAMAKVSWYTLEKFNELNNIRKGIYMKKYFLFLLTLLFLLSGCSQNNSNEIDINNPYEIAKGASTLSYYDTEEDIDIDDFNVLEVSIDNYQEKNNNILVNKEGKIRCITITDPLVKTYQSIYVGDSVDKIEDSFKYEYQSSNNYYMVLFNDNIEEDSANQNKEDDWIIIMYIIEDSKITSIRMFDVMFGREFR